jgi:hypothetical protein
MNTDGMQLYRNGVPLGALTRYGYETPWASAWLIPLDPATVERYAAIDAFLRWCDELPDDLPAAVSDERYEQEVAARGLIPALIDGFLGGWQVRTPDGKLHEISISTFEADGYLSWRW